MKSSASVMARVFHEAIYENSKGAVFVNGTKVFASRFVDCKIIVDFDPEIPLNISIGKSFFHNVRFKNVGDSSKFNDFLVSFRRAYSE